MGASWNSRRVRHRRIRILSHPRMRLSQGCVSLRGLNGWLKSAHTQRDVDESAFINSFASVASTSWATTATIMSTTTPGQGGGMQRPELYGKALVEISGCAVSKYVIDV